MLVKLNLYQRSGLVKSELHENLGPGIGEDDPQRFYSKLQVMPADDLGHFHPWLLLEG